MCAKVFNCQTVYRALRLPCYPSGKNILSLLAEMFCLHYNKLMTVQITLFCGQFIAKLKTFLSWNKAVLLTELINCNLIRKTEDDQGGRKAK